MKLVLYIQNMAIDTSNMTKLILLLLCRLWSVFVIITGGLDGGAQMFDLNLAISPVSIIFAMAVMLKSSYVHL